MKIFISTCLLLISFSLAAQENTAKPNHKLYPVLWTQTAAEYRALCYQAFTLANLRLNAIPKKVLRKGKLAIITDIDETILDNSLGEGQLIRNGQDHNEATMREWRDLAAAPAIPGAVAFLNAAHAKNITVFYISNRDTADVNATILNLQKQNFPNADRAHMLFLSNTSSKEARRQIVMADYHVIMLLGDNLNDFMQVFEKKNIEDRLAATDKVQAEWGKQFIVLPNPTYGEWENAFFNYQKNLTSAQKKEMLLALLKGYK